MAVRPTGLSFFVGWALPTDFYPRHEIGGHSPPYLVLSFFVGWAMPTDFYPRHDIGGHSPPYLVRPGGSVGIQESVA